MCCGERFNRACIAMITPFVSKRLVTYFCPAQFHFGAVVLLLALSSLVAQATPWNHVWPPATSTADVVASVPISATTVVTPPSITLNFIKPGTYQIFRKDPAATTWGTSIATTAAAATTYTDMTAAVGQLYEYKAIFTDGPSEEHIPNPITYSGSANGPPIGYIVSGINVDETQPRGRVVVVVASDVPTNLPTEYNQYISDLQADGWFVHVIPVAPVPSTVTGYDVGGTNACATITVTAGGSGYLNATTGTTNGTNIYPFTDSTTGSVAYGTLTVSATPAAGTVTAVTIVTGGAGGGFNVGDVLTIGQVASGTGSGATFQVGTVTTVGPSPVPIRAAIQAIYNQYPGQVKDLVILGKVPACRTSSKLIGDPDGHEVNDGATGADGYYANMTGTWTDTGSNAIYFGYDGITLSAPETGEVNTPNDGKFDQYYMSQTGGEADLGFGRIDLSNAINGQYEALKAYLRKLHRFKTASPDFLPGRRIILRTGDFENVDGTCWGMAYGVTGNLSNIDCIAGADLPTASDPVVDMDAAYSAQHGPYLFYFKGSGGPGIGIGGQAVFWTGCQSHWGWWYSSTTSSGENAEALRLGENSFGLSWTWSIFGTRYFYHRMAMGFDAGDMMRVSVNNVDSTNGTYAFVTDANTIDGGYIAPCTGALFMNHIGDPTLRFFMVAPPSNLSVVGTSGQPVLTWTPSSDSAVIGYHVYRSPLTAGAVTVPYTRVTTTPVTGTTFTDSDPTVAHGTGQWSYMVKAVKLETTGSGTFYNASLGSIQSIDQTNSPTTLTITSPATLPDCNWNTAYATTLTVSGGTPNYAWSVVSGTIPSGLTLTSTGAFTGTPTTAGTYNFTAMVTDALGQTAQQAFTLTTDSFNVVTLQAEASSYVYSSAPTRVQGPTETMAVSGASLLQNSFVRFNATGLSPNNALVSAKLQLYVAPGSTANNIALLEAALTEDDYNGWNVTNTPATNVTAAVNNGSGFYRITSAGHGLTQKYGALTTIAGVTPASPINMNMAFTVSVIDANTFDIPTLAYNSAYSWAKATSTPTDGITYNYQPHDNAAVLPALATAFPVPLSTITIDVTQQVAAALANDPSGKIGFRLFTNSTQIIDLCSAYSYAGAIPQLIIQTTNAPQITITSPMMNPAYIYTGSGLAITSTVTAIPAHAATVTQQWRQVSGPGTTTFSTPTLPNTTATFSAPGTYVLQLTANDSVLQSSQTLTVRVLTAPVTGPTDSLALRLPFDEGSGTTANDATGNGNTGTLKNGAGWTTAGEINGALSVTGYSGSTAQVVQVNHSSLLDGQNSMTMSFWFKTPAIDTTAVVHNMISKSGAYSFALRGNSAGVGTVYTTISGLQQNNFPISAGIWYHVAVVLDGSTPNTNIQRTYINGVPVFVTNTTATTPGVASKPTSSLFIGGTSATDTAAFNGQIDEVRIYDRALSLSEVQDLSAAAPGNMGPVITTNPSLSGASGQPLALTASVTDDGKPSPSALTYNWSQLTGPSTLSIASPTSISTSTTPTGPGTYGLQFSASDGAITTFANVAALITGQTYSNWASANIPQGDSTSQTAVTAHDGLNNLFKYALGLNPTTNYNPGAAGLPYVQVASVTSGSPAVTNNYLSMTFTGVATDVSYTVYATNDPTLPIGNWTQLYTHSSSLGTAPGTSDGTGHPSRNSLHQALPQADHDQSLTYS